MKVYLVFKNADMTEGRGPMIPVFNKCFFKREDAEKFIDSQPGVMGCKEKWSQKKFGDWEVKEIIVQ